MTSTIDSLHKILKDETRRKIILDLNEKGSVGYTDLMESLGIVSTGTLNYHLKVLGNLLEKDQTEKYMLSEKGKLASRLLTEFPEQNGYTPNKARLKAIWLICSITFTLLAFFLWYALNTPIYRLIMALFVAQVGSAFLYYIRVKPEKTGRVLWIVLGISVIGGVFWLLIQGVVKETGFRFLVLQWAGNAGFDLFALISLVITWTLGAFVGDWIGKKKKYKFFRDFTTI
jgi:DNA-binding transcriptional ArsR family regulator